MQRYWIRFPLNAKKEFTFSYKEIFPVLVTKLDSKSCTCTETLSSLYLLFCIQDIEREVQTNIDAVNVSLREKKLFTILWTHRAHRVAGLGAFYSIKYL